MKKLVQLLFVTLFTFSFLNSYAQSFGFKGGLNLSKMLIADDDETYSDEFDIQPGFHVGPIVELPVNEMISIESGLLLNTKGFRGEDSETFGDDMYEYKTVANILYVDIPVTAKARFDVGGMKVFGNFGPYVGVALSGKAENESTFNGETEKDTYDFEIGSDEEEDDIRRLDFGLLIGAGVEINSIQIGVSYGYGLANVSAYREDGNEIKNRVIGVSLGYMFGGMSDEE